MLLRTLVVCAAVFMAAPAWSQTIDPACDPVTGGPFYDPASGSPLDAQSNVIRFCAPVHRVGPSGLVPMASGELRSCSFAISAPTPFLVTVSPVEPGALIVVNVDPAITGDRTVSALRCDAVEGTQGMEVVAFLASFRAPDPPARPRILP